MPTHATCHDTEKKMPVSMRKRRDYTVYPILDENGEVQQVAIVGYDLTERKNIEQELPKTKELLLYSIGEMLTLKVSPKATLDSTILWCSTTICKQYWKIPTYGIPRNANYKGKIGK